MIHMDPQEEFLRMLQDPDSNRMKRAIKRIKSEKLTRKNIKKHSKSQWNEMTLGAAFNYIDQEPKGSNPMLFVLAVPVLLGAGYYLHSLMTTEKKQNAAYGV